MVLNKAKIFISILILKKYYLYRLFYLFYKNYIRSTLFVNMSPKILIILIFFFISFYTSFGQNGKVIINQSDKLDSVIKLKRELNSKILNLRIQIYSGDRENAESIIKEYVEFYNDTTANLIYETPNYKVWVGNYYTQLQADKKIIEIRKKFKSAFIFRPEAVEPIEEDANKNAEEDELKLD